MKKFTLGMILLFTSAAAMSGNDVWQTLFNEKLQEARQGNSNAQFDIGSMYQNGRGVAPSRSEAIVWYKKAAAQNNDMAVSRLQLLQANEERFRKELASAENGDKESQYKLGNMYTEGIGTDINLAKAAEAYEQSANQGYAKAEYKLGLVYYEGTGVNSDYKKAYTWFRKAADKDYAAAQYYLGKLYASGQGVERDYATSLEWYTRAVDGGFTQARSEMIDIAERMKTPKNSSPAPVKKNSIRKSTTTAKTEKKHPANKSFGIEDLMVAAWSRDGEPVAYLPSAINNCRTENDKIACYSDDQIHEMDDSTVKFKTKSIMRNFSSDGSFDITYRNLVIDTTEVTTDQGTREPNEIGSVTTDIGAYAVKTGWGKEHLLECRMIESSKVTCLKDKTHAFTLVSPHTVASGH
jgi:TPR repeat protein